MAEKKTNGTQKKAAGASPRPTERKAKKKSKPDWESIKTEYVTGEISYQKLADKYSVSVNTLKGHAKREKWGALRTASREKVQKRKQKKIEDKLAGEAAEEQLDILGVAYRLLEVISDKIEQYVQPKEIKAMSGALKDIKEVLGGDNDTVKTINVVISDEVKEWAE